MTVKILTGDCRDILPTLEANSVDAVVCDPPYDLTAASRNGSPRHNDPTKPFGRHNLQPKGGFMGAQWDATGVAFDPETWLAVKRVLKPGGYVLAFGGTRTYHRMTVAIEDAGFEIRDCLMYLYGSGFPKSLNVSKALDKMAGQKSEVVGTVNRTGKSAEGSGAFAGPSPITKPVTELAREYDGWGTALKPAYEPIVMARKPLRGTVATNVAAYGTGAINIDACRIGNGGGHEYVGSRDGANRESVAVSGDGLNGKETRVVPGLGRWPANVMLDDVAAEILDEQSGTLAAGSHPRVRNTSGYSGGLQQGATGNDGSKLDSGGASRFFYTSKASKAEREIGLAEFAETTVDDGRSTPIDNPFLRGGTPRRNTHPTVKNLSLMSWLVKMITPPSGTVLDPFAGSGSTLIAADRLGFDAIGVELNPEYAEIARRRVEGDAPMFADVEVTAVTVDTPRQLGIEVAS